MGDCEAIRAGLLAQPVNALSSLAYVAAGAALLSRRHDRHTRRLAVAVAVVGVGSFAFHGPGGPAAQWLHDASIVWVLLAVAATDLALVRERDTVVGVAPGVAVSGVALAAVPALGVPAAAVAGALATATEASVHRRGRRPTTARRRRLYLAGAVALLAGGAFQLLGRTGGPLCRPDSLLQPHALWHVGTALALAAWASTLSD